MAFGPFGLTLCGPFALSVDNFEYVSDKNVNIDWYFQYGTRQTAGSSPAISHNERIAFCLRIDRAPLFILIPVTSLLGAYLIALDLERNQLRQLEANIPADRIEIAQQIERKAVEYGVNPLVLREVARCESGFKHDNLFGDGGHAYGVFQFHQPTFNEFKFKALMPDLDYFLLEDQIELAAWAFAHGKENHWTCYKKLPLMIVKAP